MNERASSGTRDFNSSETETAIIFCFFRPKTNQIAGKKDFSTSFLFGLIF
jgi:hypothetical protein